MPEEPGTWSALGEVGLCRQLLSVHKPNQPCGVQGLAPSPSPRDSSWSTQGRARRSHTYVPGLTRTGLEIAHVQGMGHPWDPSIWGHRTGQALSPWAVISVLGSLVALPHLDLLQSAASVAPGISFHCLYYLYS